ncbi:Transketolase [Dehalobacter sp. UNSWDHB]|jgi:Transketolase, C-terminal subunit|uniref:transketolase family protein n=1 Tax=unclassified Dehalobacter TaxID=2635733 RepID=UPI00028BBE2B|nr:MULTISPECIES: transketolase C-terminal domain-containing protein [unclassified Dehalobacter]AFV02588.1 Transketolase, C-terminal section [Dehalobacter sp. DCA]AFV05574.1 Transketolase, C-terminal section [Dehalobacter sp. CF]EQB21750.1 Transketolase [Dehalobacter sp. UNSWDHB]
MRITYINTLTKMARENPKIVCVIGDTGFSVFEDFEKEFRDRFVNVGIAEQNFVGFGAGLAAMGLKPYIYNVASFMTLRAMEQIVLDVCFQENPVVMVGVGGGLAYGNAGPTHHAPFDIAMLRVLPNMNIICPADPVEMRAAMLASEHFDKPLYIRIGRSVDPIVHNKEIDFRIGKALKMRDGGDAVLFATGTMVKDAVKACELLEHKGISMALYSMHTIKPLDEELILNCVGKYKAMFTLEEHSMIGGLGSAVSEVLARHMGSFSVKLRPFGFPDDFAPVTGSREYLNELYGISPVGVAAGIEETLSQR